MSDQMYATICYGRGLPTSNTYSPNFSEGVLKIPVYNKKNYYVAAENGGKTIATITAKVARKIVVGE